MAEQEAGSVEFTEDHAVTWFVVDRPVSGGTVWVDQAGDGDCELAGELVF